MSLDTSNDLRVTLVQCDLRWEDPAANCAHIDRLLGDLGAEQTDLILLPEMFATGFTMNSQQMAEDWGSSPVTDWMLSQAEKRKCIVTGSVAIKDKGECYNRLVWALPSGDVQIYDKRHLFRMAGEHLRYAMGQERIVVEVKGFKVLLSVCYDLRFPVWMRQQPEADVSTEYDVIVCVANWPAPRRTPWRVLLRARAIENLAYVVGVNRVGEDAKGNQYSGDSLCVDFKGDILCDHPQNTAFIETCTLSLSALQSFREAFPAWQDADQFSLS